MWKRRFEHPIVDAPLTNGDVVIVATEAGEIHIIPAYQEEEIEEAEAEVVPEQVLNVEGSILRSPVPIGKWLFVQTDTGIYRFSAQEESE